MVLKASRHPCSLTRKTAEWGEGFGPKGWPAVFLFSSSDKGVKDAMSLSSWAQLSPEMTSNGVWFQTWGLPSSKDTIWCFFQEVVCRKFHEGGS